MPAQPTNDDVHQVLDILDVHGVDATTPPWQISPKTLVDCTNFLPDQAYGALTTALGRGPIPGVGNQELPGPCRGVTLFYRYSPFANRPPVYIFAIDFAGDGTLWALPQDGSGPLVQLGLPVGHLLTPGQQTFFAESGVWMFVSNGTDTPLKIDNDLNVTLWGIDPPSTGPTVTGDSVSNGGLSFGAAPYYYCVTFGVTKTSITNPGQESSQGKVVGPFTLDQTNGTGSFEYQAAISGIGADFNFQFTLVLGSVQVAVGAPYVSVGGGVDSPARAANLTAQAINAAPPIPYQKPAGGTGILTVTAHTTGTLGQVNITVADSTGHAVDDAGFISYFVYDEHSIGGIVVPDQNSPATLVAGVTQNCFDLTNIPISTDDQVTERNIYRLGGDLGQWRLVTTLMDNTTTTYQDTTSDANLTGQALTVFRDAPPPFAYICTHQQRVFGFNTLHDPSAGAGNRNNASSLWWSNYGEPWGFDGLNNVLQVGESLEGNPGIGMASIGSMLGICKKRNFYALYGNSDDTFATGLFKVADIGCSSSQSICAAYGLMGWIGRQGAYIWNGSLPQNISDGNYQQSNIKNVFDQTSRLQLKQTIGFMYGRMIGFVFPNMGRTYMYNPRDASWWPLPYEPTQMCYSIEDDIPVTAVRDNANNNVDAWFLYGTDLGQPLVATAVTRITSDPDFSWSKSTQWFMVDAPMQSVVHFQWQFTTDPGPMETQWPITFGNKKLNLSVGLPRHYVPMPQIRYVDLQLAFQINTTQPATVINRIAVYSHLEAFAASEADGIAIEVVSQGD